MFFHILAHVKAHHIVLGIEQRFGQRLAQLGFAHPRGAEENKGPQRTRGIGKTGPRAQHGVSYGGDGLILPHHTFMQLLRQRKQFFPFGLQQPRDRYPRPAGHDIRHVVRPDFLLEQRRLCSIRPGFQFPELFFQLEQRGILQFGRTVQIIIALRLFYIVTSLLNLFLHLTHGVNGTLFLLPLGAQSFLLRPQICQFILQLLQTLA